MICEWELWAVAHAFVRKHGADAAVFAAMRADALFEEGDLDGAQTFRLIVHKVNELQRGPKLLQ